MLKIICLVTILRYILHVLGPQISVASGNCGSCTVCTNNVWCTYILSSVRLCQLPHTFRIQRDCASEIDAFRAPERSMIAVMITTASLHEPDDSYSEHGVLEAVLRTENTSLKRIFSQSTNT